MDNKKCVGIITRADFGSNEYRGFGLHLEIKHSDGSPQLYGFYEDTYEWENEDERNKAWAAICHRVMELCADAGVIFISHLVGKPVEITVVDGLITELRF